MRVRLSLWMMVAAVVVASALLAANTQEPTSEYLETQLQLAELLYAEGRYQEALEVYTQLQQLTERLQWRRASKGLVRSALRVARFVLAREEATELREAAPDDSEAIALHGDALWSSGLFQEAEQAYEDALRQDPESARAYNGRARSLAAKSRLGAALEAAELALERSPREAELHHTSGMILERLNRFDDAAAALANYVNLLPNRERSDKAAWARAEIRFLRSFGRRVPLEMAPDQGQTMHTVPFKLVNDKVVVRATINEGRAVDLVLDTGAEKTVLSRRTAQRLGVTPIVYTLSAGVGDVGLRGLQLGRLDSLEIGSLTLKNVPCLIKSPSLGGIPSREPDGFSPLALGLSTVIDYQRRRLTMARELPAEPMALELPLRVHRLATVRGTINGRPYSFVVDTGGQVISIGQSIVNAIMRSGSRRIPLKVYGTSGWDKDAFLLPGVHLGFNEIQFPNFPVVVLNLDAPSALLGFQVGGIVGHNFLSKYRVGIDLDRSVVRLSEM